jgi:hypothetical protein
MKKALWFQLRALLPADSLTPLADAEQLARYRYQRAVPRRTLARAEQERIYKARVVQWL